MFDQHNLDLLILSLVCLGGIEAYSRSLLKQWHLLRRHGFSCAFCDFRFYNDESDFIHGSLDSSCGPGAVTGVRGQQEIHRTILSLNFHDCYARIAYVDAQESTNKSVVVQVAGELSNRVWTVSEFFESHSTSWIFCCYFSRGTPRSLIESLWS